MDIKEKLLESVKGISTAYFGVSLLLVASSLYLISRSINVSFGKVNPTSFTSQASYIDLQFTYLTLTILWPIIIGILCLALVALCKREIEIMTILKRELKEVDPLTVNAL
jgi:hypothetical protein